MNSTSLTRLSVVHPDLQKMITSLAQQFDEKFPGWTLEVTQGWRPSDEQAALYAQGRQAIVAVNVLRAKVRWAPITQEANKVVTNAPPGYSWHEYALAIDVAPQSIQNPQIDWDGDDQHWDFIVEAGEALGMESGLSWKDEPHFQLKNIPISPDQETRYLFAEAGISGVWKNIPDGTNASGTGETQDV